MRILIVENDHLLSNNIVKLLRHEHYKTFQAYDGEKALNFLYTEHIDLILLDIKLPKLNGLSLIRLVRASENKIPILVASSSSDIEDKVQTLDIGADDYLCKPFSNLELLARIRALLRRESLQKSSLLHYQELTFDMNRHCLSKNGEILELTNTQLQIMELFLHNIGTVLTRLHITEYLWGSFATERSENTINVHIKNLRKIIGSNIIHTVRSVGYVIKKT